MASGADELDRDFPVHIALDCVVDDPEGAGGDGPAEVESGFSQFPQVGARVGRYGDGALLPLTFHSYSLRGASGEPSSSRRIQYVAWITMCKV